MFVLEVFLLVGEVFPLAVVFEACHILRSKLHLGEFLREVLGAVLVVQLWLIWGLLLLLVNGIPVNAGEPRMGHDFLGVGLTRSKTGLWVLIE